MHAPQGDPDGDAWQCVGAGVRTVLSSNHRDCAQLEGLREKCHELSHMGCRRLLRRMLLHWQRPSRRGRRSIVASPREQRSVKDSQAYCAICPSSTLKFHNRSAPGGRPRNDPATAPLVRQRGAAMELALVQDRRRAQSAAQCSTKGSGVRNPVASGR